MWSADPRPEYCLVLGADRLEWGIGVRKGGALAWQSQRAIRYAEEALPVSLRLAIHDLADALGEPASGSVPAGASLRVLVSDRWLSLVDLPWSERFADKTEADPYLCAILAAEGYDLAEDDILSFDAPHWGERVLVARWPAEIFRALQEFAAALELRFVSLLPLPLAVCAAQDCGGAIVIVENGWGRFYESVVYGGRCSLRPLGERLPIESLADVPVLCVRQRLRWPSLTMPVRGVLLAPDAYPDAVAEDSALIAWAKAGDGDRPLLDLAGCAFPRLSGHGLDAAPVLPATTPRQWGTLAMLVGLLSLTVTLLALTFARTPSPPAPEPVVVRHDVPTAIDPRRVSAVAAAVATLNLPVDALLRQLVPPRDIRALPVDIDLGRDSASRDAEAGVLMKLLVESPAAEDMSRYVAFLAERPKLDRIQLLRHEISEADPARPYRYHVELRWKD